jgi:leucyl aminopeptidase
VPTRRKAHSIPTSRTTGWSSARSTVRTRARQAVRVEATVWAWTGGGDYLDLYYSGSAASQAWVLLTTLAAGTGAQTLTATYTLPAGGLQAVRARFRYQGVPSPCSAGAYTDHDDLVFAAQE